MHEASSNQSIAGCDWDRREREYYRDVREARRDYERDIREAGGYARDLREMERDRRR